MIRCLIVFFVLIVIHVPLYGQSNDHRGKEFYIVFCPNTGGEQGTERNNRMALFIEAEMATTIRVQIPALQFEREFPGAFGILTIELPNGNNNEPTVIIQNSETAEVDRAVHVTADQEISVYGLNSKTFSADAFLALPVDVLGKEYYAMSYPVSAQGSSRRVPGQFAIAATMDGTMVTVMPACSTFNGKAANETFSVSLDAGDVYLVQSATAQGSDLTGSHIVASQPVAVFSGHERTELPAGTRLFNGNSPSRDHLVEQLPSVDTWGTLFIVAPFRSSEKPELVRIVSGAPSNIVTVNGIAVDTLDRGQFYEITELAGAAHIVTSGPALVGQYMHTSWGELDNPEHPAYGDPSLTLVTPVVQFLDRYEIFAIDDENFSASFINLVARTDSRSAILLDDNAIGDSAWQQLEGTEYSFTQLPIASGRHTLSSNGEFGVTVYGFSSISSYAMPGGTALRRTASDVCPVAVTSERVIERISEDGSQITFELARSLEGSTVTLTVYDVLGRRVYAEEIRPIGLGITVDLQRVSKGAYFYQLNHDSSSESGSLLRW